MASDQQSGRAACRSVKSRPDEAGGPDGEADSDFGLGGKINDDVVDAFARLAASSQPPGKSRRRRGDDAKGLPDPETLNSLSKLYLETQRRLWPDLARRGLLPKPTPKAIAELAAEFEARFRDGEAGTVGVLLSSPPWQELAAAYLRFSDDNSNPRSLVQQLRNVLELAARDGAFVPWAYVFADAAVTGTVAARRGYLACKELLRNRDAGVGRHYVDEIGRASRDAIEALSLGRLVDGLGLRMLGVSDGFDSARPEAKLQLHLYAMMQEWFVDQLRSKVNRGMADAFLSGANLYAACLGYKLVPKADADGNPVLDREGRAEMTRAIDPEGAAWVKEAYDLFVVRGWNRSKIALHFNEHAVGGSRCWDAGRILQLLDREVYIGVEYYRKTKQRRDPVTGKVTTVKVPRSRQLSRELPHLRLVSDEVWDLAQQKIARSRAARTKDRDRPRKSEVYPKTLLRPVCGHCNEPLILGRSGKYASFCCLNGRDGKKRCPLRSYKSVRVIEEAVLGHLREHYLTDAFVGRLLADANAFLAAEASKPPADVAPLEAELRRKEAAVKRIAARLERVEDASRLDAAFAELGRLEGEAETLRARLEELRPRDAPPVRPFATAEVERLLLEDLRGLLSDEAAAAAPVLGSLVGPITVVPSPERSKRGTAWAGTFSVDPVPGLAALAARKGCATTSGWERLAEAGRRPAPPVTLTFGVGG